MKAPQYIKDAGKTSCEDLSEFLITNKSTHFQPLLPDIFHFTRGNDDHCGPNKNLYAFLADLTGEIRGESKAKWITQSFLLCTSIEPTK